jgi:hypothetical protein
MRLNAVDLADRHDVLGIPPGVDVTGDDELEFGGLRQQGRAVGWDNSEEQVALTDPWVRVERQRDVIVTRRRTGEGAGSHLALHALNGTYSAEDDTWTPQTDVTIRISRLALDGRTPEQATTYSFDADPVRSPFTEAGDEISVTIPSLASVVGVAVLRCRRENLLGYSSGGMSANGTCALRDGHPATDQFPAVNSPKL